MDQHWVPVASASVSGIVSLLTLFIGRRMLMADRKLKGELAAGKRKISRQNTDADQLWTLYEDLREEAKNTEASLRQEMKAQGEEHRRQLEALRLEHREEIHQIQEMHREQIEEITTRYEARIESFIQFIAQRQGQKEARDALDRSLRAGETAPGD